MQVDLRARHERLREKLAAGLAGNSQPIRVRKKTISNLFRYEGRAQLAARQVDLRRFNRPLHIDVARQTLDVQGLATFESIVDFTLPRGFLPTVTPELKHITVGGATVGIGIETNSYRYGFVHDGLLEAEVLLPGGDVVVCTPDNEYSDLFHGLPNSYGTLGYILRAKIQLRPAKPYVALTTEKFTDYKSFLKALHAATDTPANDYIESMIYSHDESYLITGRQTTLPKNLKSIYGRTIFYKEVSRAGQLSLPTKEYMFRYDPEWFWALPESGWLNIFRAYAPAKLRNSSFYSRYTTRQRAISAKRTSAQPHEKIDENDDSEQLIQDWEVPWRQADALLKFALDTFDLAGKPIMAVPLKTPANATCYPMLKNELYLNLGSYGFVRKRPGQPAYHNTKAMDEFCFKHQGIKMLYSTTFLDEPAFNRIYNGAAYASLKQKYDPKNLSPTLFEKAVKAR